MEAALLKGYGKRRPPSLQPVMSTDFIIQCVLEDRAKILGTIQNVGVLKVRKDDRKV